MTIKHYLLGLAFFLCYTWSFGQHAVKNGLDIKYHKNGRLKSKIYFVDGKPYGVAQIFSKEGNISESGYWFEGRWIGNYNLYYENGQKHQQFNYGIEGKRIGLQTDYFPNGIISGIGFYIKGKIIEPYYNFDSLGHFLNKDIGIYDSIKKENIIVVTTQTFPTDSTIIDYVKNENQNIFRINSLQKAQIDIQLSAQKLKTEKQKNTIYLISSFIFGLLLLIILFILKSLRKSKTEIEGQNKLILEKNKDILDSLRYAKRIQTSLLPTDKYLDRVLTQKDKSTGE